MDNRMKKYPLKNRMICGKYRGCFLVLRGTRLLPKAPK